MLPNSSKTFVVGLIVVIGALLRFHALDRQSLWDDEMSTLKTISLAPRDALQRYRTYETHPPLYFIQLRAWNRVCGGSLSALRANSAFWGSLGIFLIYLLGVRLGGRPVGVLSAALLALSPLHLAYSQELRPYALAIAIALAGFLVLLDRRWMLLTLLWTSQLYTHYWGAFVVAAAFTYGWWTAEDWKGRRSLLFSGLAAGLLFSPWLFVLRSQFGVVRNLVFWAPPPSVANLGKTLVAFSGTWFRFASNTFYVSSALELLGLMAAVYVGLLLWGILKGPLLASLWLGVGLGLPWILSYSQPVLYVWYRYPVHMLPAAVLLVAVGLRAIPQRWGRVVLAVICLGSQLWGSWIYFHGWEKANPKAVVEYVNSLERDPVVVLRPTYFADLYAVYNRGRAPVEDPNEYDSPERRATLKGKTVLLVAFDVGDDPLTQAFRSEFRPVSVRYFPGHSHLGITVYEFRSRSLIAKGGW